MKQLRQIQQELLLSDAQAALADMGMSPTSAYGRRYVQNRVCKGTGKPIYKPAYVSGKLDAAGFNSQLKDIALDLKALTEVSLELDKAISLNAILADIEHRITQAKLDDLMVLTTYIGQGGLIFVDSFNTTEYIDVDNSTAVIDTALGCVKSKTSVRKTRLFLPDQAIILEPQTTYDAISLISDSTNFLRGSGVYAIIYKSKTPNNFTARMTIALPELEQPATLTLRSVAGYLETSWQFSATSAVENGLLTTAPFPITVPAGTRQIIFTFSKPVPDYEEAGSYYYVFGFDKLALWNITISGTSYIITKPISFNDFGGNPIALHNATVIARKLGNGTVKPYVAVCTPSQPPASLSWVPIDSGTVITIANNYDGTITAKHVEQLSTAQLKIASLPPEVKTVRIYAGYGTMVRRFYTTTVRSITKRITGYAEYTYYQGSKRVKIPVSDFGLAENQSLPQRNLFRYIRIGSNDYDLSIPYSIIGVPGSQYVRLDLPRPNRRRYRRYVPEQHAIDEDILPYDITITILETAATSANNTWTGVIYLDPEETIQITAKRGTVTLINLEALSKSITVSPGSAISLSYSDDWRAIGISVTGTGKLADLFTCSNANKILSYGILNQARGAPAPGEYIIKGTDLIIGNVCINSLTRTATGIDYSIADLMNDPASFFKIEYRVVDAGATAVRFKFELNPADDPTFAFTEYVAAFQPTILAAELRYLSELENFVLPDVKPTSAPSKRPLGYRGKLRPKQPQPDHNLTMV